MSDTIYSIYKITNRRNGKVYIGYTENYVRRWYTHLHKYLSSNEHPKLYRAMRKYGIENFHFEIIYQSKDFHYTKKEMERIFISKYDSIALGYNIAIGGEGYAAMKGKKHTENAKRKISESSTRTWKEHPEYLTQMSARHSGKVMTKESRLKMSIAKLSPNITKLNNKEWLIENYQNQRKSVFALCKELHMCRKTVKHALEKFGIPRHSYIKSAPKAKWSKERREAQSKRQIGRGLGKKTSEETRQKQSKSHRKYTYEITFPDNHIEITNNLPEFCKKHGLIATIMSRVLLGKRPHHKGFKCIRLTDENKTQQEEQLALHNNSDTA
jgi:group I intron endonuclease